MHISAKAVIMKKNKFLLQLRDNKKNIYAPNSWGFFGGKAEKNEKIETCIKREINEELSVKCVKAKKICETFYRKKVLLVFFNVKTIGKINSKKLTEGQGLGWFSKKEIKKIKKSWEVNFLFDTFNY